jgi:hypothetical protein
MPKQPSPKMIAAREMIKSGGSLSVTLQTIYGSRKVGGCYSSRRGIVYRVFDAEGSGFYDLTKYQAKSFAMPEQWAKIEAMESVGERLNSPQFRDRVELNQQARIDDRLKQACSQWREGTHPIESWAV